MNNKLVRYWGNRKIYKAFKEELDELFSLNDGLSNGINAYKYIKLLDNGDTEYLRAFDLLVKDCKEKIQLVYAGKEEDREILFLLKRKVRDELDSICRYFCEDNELGRDSYDILSKLYCNYFEVREENREILKRYSRLANVLIKYSIEMHNINTDEMVGLLVLENEKDFIRTILSK